MATDEPIVDRFPRRTLRRQQTRARILKTAKSLFRRVGYGATTMNAIADAADVHVTTLFTHFRAKRDLAISLNAAGISRLEQLIAENQGQRLFLEFFEALVMDSVGRIEHPRQPDLSLWHEMRDDPELTFAWVQYEKAQVALFARYIAHDYGLDLDLDYRPSMVAALLVSSAWLAHQRWTDSAGGRDLTAETRAALDVSVAMARSALV